MRPVEKACITGGSSGIGLAVAGELVRRGADVLLIARDPVRLAEAAEGLKARGTRPGQIVRTLALDVGDGAAVKALLPPAARAFGDPDLLVNCAGSAYPGYFAEIPDGEFEKALDVHLKGTWYVTRALLDGLVRRRGVLVNVSSIAGLVGVFGYSAYGPAKFGVIGLSEALRSELAPRGVRVAVLCPPDTDTPGFRRENLTKPVETRAVSGNVRALSPEEVARELFAGLGKKKFLIVPGLSGKFAVFMIRRFPGLTRRVMDHQIRRASVMGPSPRGGVEDEG